LMVIFHKSAAEAVRVEYVEWSSQRRLPLRHPTLDDKEKINQGC